MLLFEIWSLGKKPFTGMQTKKVRRFIKYDISVIIIIIARHYYCMHAWARRD